MHVCIACRLLCCEKGGVMTVVYVLYGIADMYMHGCICSCGVLWYGDGCTDASGNGFGDEGAVWLSALLGHLPKLTQLNIASKHVTCMKCAVL